MNERSLAVCAARDDRHLKHPGCDVERVVLDELAARLDDVAHQDREHLVGFDGVVVVQIDLQQLALLRVHRGLEKLLRVHFAEAFEALDLHAAPADLDDLLVNLGNGEERMHRGLFAFAFDQLEDRVIARGVVLDLQTFAREFGDDLLDRWSIRAARPASRAGGRRRLDFTGGRS